MNITSADFVCSYPRESLCPKDGKSEFAFIGRSNVGKSSLINMLTSRKGLAKVSSTPGKTQLINYFLINQQWHLVDLPGYGYAKVSKSMQVSLSKMINGYLLSRKEISMIFVLVDANINPPSKVDLAFLGTLAEKGVEYTIIFTKCDRIGGTTLDKNIGAFMEELSKHQEKPPHYFLTSSERTRGRDEVLDYIHKIIKSH
jgi:GTP-binding protein